MKKEDWIALLGMLAITVLVVYIKYRFALWACEGTAHPWRCMFFK